MALRSGVLDASVLYVESVRSLLLWISNQGGFAPFWTERILEETRNNLIEGGVIAAEQWDRLRAAMLRTFPDAMVEQAAVDALEDPMPNDEKDRHVLATAVVADTDLVVTSNVRHFRPADLEPLGKRSIAPDALLCDLLYVVPNIVRESLELQASYMRAPRAWTVPELLGLLAGLGHADAPTPECWGQRRHNWRKVCTLELGSDVMPICPSAQRHLPSPVSSLDRLEIDSPRSARLSERSMSSRCASWPR